MGCSRPRDSRPRDSEQFGSRWCLRRRGFLPGGRVLEAIAIGKNYGGLPAVEGVSFRLEAGQVLGCLGPNGSGKSTTVKMLIGMLEPTRGQVRFRGEDIQRDLMGYRRVLGY